MNSGGKTIFIGALLACSMALASDKPADLSGKWVLEKSEQSYSPPASAAASEGGAPGGEGRMGGGFPGGGGGGGFPGGGGGFPGGGGGFPGGGGGGRRGGGGFPGGGQRGGGPADPTVIEPQDLVLDISQSPTAVKIERHWTRDGNARSLVQSFTPDGTENHNPADMGTGDLTSKTRWKKSTLVIEGKQPMPGRAKDTQMQLKQEYSLSKDGRALTVKTTRITPRGLFMTKQVFRKA
jgi:hypothetical protein